MVRVQFNDKKSMHQVDFSIAAPGIVQLTGKKIPKCTEGFRVYRMNGDFLGDYSEYTEIVAEVENGLQFGESKTER